MKRIALIEWGIVTVSLILGFKFVMNFLSVIVQLIFFSNRDMAAEALLKLLLVTALYFVASFLLIRNSLKIATFINGPHRADESISLAIGKRALLHVILVTICIITLLSDIAIIIYHFFDILKNRPGGRGITGLLDNFGSIGDRYRLMQAVVEAIVAAVVLGFSRKIAYRIIRENEPDELTIDANPVN